MGISAAGFTAGVEGLTSAIGPATTALGGLGSAMGGAKTLGALGAGATALSSMGGMPSDKPWEEQAVAQLGTQEAQQGQQLMSYLATGNLPPGMESKMKQLQAGKTASVKSDYAARGQTGSTAEHQDVSNISDTIMAMRSDIAMKLYEMGAQQQSEASKIFTDLLGREDTLNQQTTSDFGDFATALAGVFGSGGSK